uniref:Dynein light chain n=1 Tax=Pelusios castaneus TaxID=367368 RepID=A0A8C8RJK8_9SAUR
MHPNFTGSYFLSGLEQKNCDLTQVKIDEVLCLVCYIAAKISANNAVPKYLFYICCNVFLYVVLLHCLRSTVYSILLHVLRHVCILDHSLSVRHREPMAEHKALRHAHMN